MTNIAFIGLGIMGGPMAAQPGRTPGTPSTGYNRQPGAGRALVDAGGTGRRQRRRGGPGAEVVVTMVPDSPDVEDVSLGEDGVFAQRRAAARCSSTSPASGPTSRGELAEQAPSAGFRAARRPGLRRRGGRIKSAALSIMVGGEADDFAEARPIFDARRQDHRPRRPARRRARPSRPPTS